LVPDEAIAFFAARARGIRPGFALDDAVPLICRRVDDLPLALELAAARVKALSPAQILDRLERRLPLLTGGARDAPERQRTLRATIEWSHDLLNEDEQRLYARLAVFRGGCSLDDAEQVADADLDAMQSLVDKSLLRHNEDRFWMLETIREHAEEHLEASGEADELRRRHALQFVALAEEADPYLREVALRGGHHHLDWLDRLEAEHDNLRAALDRLAAAGETQLVLRAAGALVEFWFENAHFVELRTRLLAALEADSRPTAPRAKALLGASDTLAISNDDAGATRCADEALAIYRALGDRSGAADSLFRLGVGATEQGDCEAALPRLEEARRLFEELDDRDALLHVTRSLGWTFERLGDRERARELYAENLAHARAIGNTYIASASLGALATFAAEEGRADEARALAREHLPKARDFGKLELSTSLFRAAYVLAHLGRAEAAATVLACAAAIADEIGATQRWLREMNLQTSELAEARLGEKAFADASERGRALTTDEAVTFALDALD
jgi:non-specific serine/threonine protein kinase